tara:strand:- start:1190 stop:2089 length:900 start_codon:yes stop_codon:yes gene_type:complete
MIKIPIRHRFPNHLLDAIINIIFFVFAISCACLFLLILLFLIKETWPILAGNDVVSLPSLFKSDGWYPLEGLFGLNPMILASLAVTLGAIILALPIGVASALFIQFYSSPKVAMFYRVLLNLLTGIPSVVFGLWGLTELVPLIASYQPPGASLLAAILVLSLMITPTIALTSTAALSAVPTEIMLGAQALGLSKKTQLLSVVVPAAKAGIIGGTLLATARALGETMAVMMVAGNVVQNPSGLFEPVRVLTANIALEMAYAMEGHRASLFASGLLLTLIVWLLVYLAQRVQQTSIRRIRS